MKEEKDFLKFKVFVGSLLILFTDSKNIFFCSPLQSQDADSEEDVGEGSQFMKLAKKITIKTLHKSRSNQYSHPVYKHWKITNEL